MEIRLLPSNYGGAWALIYLRITISICDSASKKSPSQIPEAFRKCNVIRNKVIRNKRHYQYPLYKIFLLLFVGLIKISLPLQNKHGQNATTI